MGKPRHKIRGEDWSELMPKGKKREGQVKRHEDLQHVVRTMVFNPKTNGEPLKKQKNSENRKGQRLAHAYGFHPPRFEAKPHAEQMRRHEWREKASSETAAQPGKM